jgi:hypothetical protein
MYDPKPEYSVIPGHKISIKDFYDYEDEFVVRPPYQRKNVWDLSKQKALLDSLFRRYYIPKVIIREVRINKEETKKEIIDGQQRIITVKNFFDNSLKLPDSLADLKKGLEGMKYEELPTEIKKFVDKKLVFDIDIIHGIDNPKDSQHQKIATEIFWRLQQGESLNYMEIAHSRLSSLARNFIVKYSDDITFDYPNYEPIDLNEDKHSFFDVIHRDNNRMQHLALLTRFLLFEFADGPTDVKESNVAEFIDKYQREDGIGNYSFEETKEAKAVLGILNTFFSIFKSDPMFDEESGVRELSTEYFIISSYLLIRHLKKYYAFTEDKYNWLYDFIINEFYTRWYERSEDDNDIHVFISNRQQSKAEIESRDRIIRQIFFEYLKDKGYDLFVKDEKRTFDEGQRIKIYRNNDGLCQECLQEEKEEVEARVSWSEFQADHVLPHSKGGRTIIENGQVLCRYHNSKKGNKIE